MLLAGIDFTCSPSSRKPITVAAGRLRWAVRVQESAEPATAHIVARAATASGVATLEVESLDELLTLADFEAWLQRPGPWLGAFDFPFGLPRAFVDANALGSSCAEVIAQVHARCPTRMAWRAFIDTWSNAQPAGARLLHRRTDAASAVVSTSPLQTRYVPVGLMYYEGVARLVSAGVAMPGLLPGDPQRVALEGYPRRLAHALVERRSYKNSELDDRRATREAIVRALETGHERFGFGWACSAPIRDSLVADTSGDQLDAVLCLVQAAVASGRRGLGLPEAVDPVEGWIAAE